MRRGMTVIGLVAALASACSDEGGDLDAFCATARRFTADNPADAFERLDPQQPDGTSEALLAAAEQLQGWAEDAPEEVRSDVEILVLAAEDLAVAFEPAEDGTVEDDAIAAIDVVVVGEASASVLAFTIEQCQVDLDPATTSPVAPATTAPPADG